jgi:hypothetical protein
MAFDAHLPLRRPIQLRVSFHGGLSRIGTDKKRQRDQDENSSHGIHSPYRYSAFKNIGTTEICRIFAGVILEQRKRHSFLP